MKYLRILPVCWMVLLSFQSCSSDDNGPQATFDQLVVVSADLPASFTLGSLYDIPITFELPDGCTEYYSFGLTSPTQETREVAVVGIRTDDGGCTPQIREATETLVFQVQFDQTYLFRFWQGNDAQGNPQYLEIEVPVN